MKYSSKQRKPGASLLDKLTDLAPGVASEMRPLKTLGRKRLLETVRRDLMWLFNTRTSLRADLFDARELTVIDYGIPDFGNYFTFNTDDHTLIAARLKRAIDYFEPRLKKVSVMVRLIGDSDKELLAEIKGELVVDKIKIPVSFLTVLQKGTDTLVLNEY